MQARPTRIAASLALASALLAASFATLAASSPDRESRAPAEAGVLRVAGKLKPSTSMYIEGALEYVSVRRTGSGSLVLKREFGLGRIQLVRRLMPGSYRLASWTRTCSGNCDNLDPPAYACARRIRITAGRTLRATVSSQVGKPCRITVASG